MTANLKPVDQLGFDEQTIDDPSIEAALEEREKRKHSYDAVRKTFEAANEVAVAKIAELELPEGGAARVGRFRITRQEIPAGHREFDTKASSRIRISLVDKGDTSAPAPTESAQEPISNFRRDPE
jgi:hypothetical protein